MYGYAIIPRNYFDKQLNYILKEKRCHKVKERTENKQEDPQRKGKRGSFLTIFEKIVKYLDIVFTHFYYT